MAVRIRLRRVGRKKTPIYRIIIADSTSPRDGRFIETIGQYDPRRTGEGGLKIDAERANYWLNVGAQPSDTVRSLLRKVGVMKDRYEKRKGESLRSSAVPIGDAAKPESGASA